METTLELTNEMVVSRILGITLDRVEYLKTEFEMPVTDPEFSDWFVEHPEIVLDELKRNFESLLFPGQFGPEFSEPSA